MLSSVYVTMGGVDITGANYADGSIYIGSVTGDIVITATAVEVSEEVTAYTITNNLANVTSDNSAVSVEENSAYTATLTAADGYDLDSVTVTMGGVDVTNDVYADGVISIPAVTGNIVITANAVTKDMTLDEANIIVRTTGSEVSLYNEKLNGLDKVYYYYCPVDVYKKELVIRARYTSSWSYAVVVNTSSETDIVTAIYDHYSDKGFVVYEIDVHELMAKVQSMYDSGTLDSSKTKQLFIYDSYASSANAQAKYLLYSYSKGA